MSSSRLISSAARSPRYAVNGQFLLRSSVTIDTRQILNSWHSRSYPSAYTLLLPIRLASTSTYSSTKPPTKPPPGFNIEQAQKSVISNNTLNVSNNSESASKLLENRDLNKNVSDESSATSKLVVSDPLSSSEVTSKGKEGLKDVETQEKKLTLTQKIKKEAQHYWDGTKLLAAEIKISTKLALKMAAGYELSRREHKQLQRTVKDIARLVPFSVFILVPFAELLLPVALKIFPNMLPSTYEGQKSKDTKATTLRVTRKEVSNFLRDTLKETGLPLSPATARKGEFAQFFRKIRATGESPSSDEVIKVCTLFKDDLTLDNLSRPQLVGMCRYMNLNTFGTDMMLRYQIRHRMRQIKRDDHAINFEGVESLSVPELQVACMSRGLRTHGVSPARLRDDLQSWLDLRLKHGVPSTLLVLSNAFMYAQGKSDSEFNSQIDALTGVLSSIPEELFHEMELEVNNAEGAATNKQRLEVLKEQQELIEEENEQNEDNKEAGQVAPRDNENIDEKEEKRIEANEADPDMMLDLGKQESKTESTQASVKDSRNFEKQ